MARAVYNDMFVEIINRFKDSLAMKVVCASKHF